jgi:tetratricopeptide (TPR) repeat protein
VIGIRGLRGGFVRVLLASAFLLPAGEGGAEERPSPSELIIRAPDSQPQLEDLIRQGLESSAHGDLEGASRAWQRIREHHPEHPAAPVYEVHTLEARKALDVQDERYDVALRAKANEGIALSEAWLERVPDDPEAHFYAGQAKHALMIVTGMAGEYYRAGTTGEQARVHLERAIELDPTFVDAKLPLGSYYYYTSVASRFIRWFSWLWFVPTGEHDLGLAYLEEVSRKGDLLRFDADMRLVEAYLYLEHQPERAAPILYRLHEAYPENSSVAFEGVELELMQGDYPATIAKALELEHREGTQYGDDTRRKMAKVWRARAELFGGEIDRADAVLAELDGSWDSLSLWCRRWLLLTKGNLEDLRGRRSDAVAYYERVIALQSRWDSERSVKLAQEGLDEQFRLEGIGSGPVVSTSRVDGAPPAR